MKAQYKEDIPLPSALRKDFPECKKMCAVWKTCWALAEAAKLKTAEADSAAREQEAEAEQQKQVEVVAKETVIVGDEDSADKGRMVTRRKKKALTVVESDEDEVEVASLPPKCISGASASSRISWIGTKPPSVYKLSDMTLVGRTVRISRFRLAICRRN